VEEEPNPNLPTARQAARMRIPEARHRAARVGERTKPHGNVNTVAMPWVDFGQDLTDILAGLGIRDGNRFEVNGRSYVMEGEGRLCPLSGDGLIQLGRGAYRALGMYNDWGLTETAEVRVDRARIQEGDRQAARQIWLGLHTWRQEHG
jgi:hypothetical protein